MRTSLFASTRRSAFSACILLFAALLFSLPLIAVSPGTHKVAHLTLPVRFEPNRGQAPRDVRFLAHSAGYTVELKSTEVTIAAQQHDAVGRFVREVPVTMFLDGASNPAIVPFGPLSGVSNYLPNSDRRSWITGIPTFSGVLYRGVYSKTDLVFRGDDSRLEYDFRIAPGGSPSAIAWRLHPGADVRLENGDLVIVSDGVQLHFLKPVAYQESGAVKEPVAAHYRLRRDARGTRVEFAVGSYDRHRALVIDPVLVYATQFSGMNFMQAMTADSTGNVFLASGYNGGLQIAKLAADGKTVAYTSTIGTSSTDIRDIALDGSGQLYVTGEAVSGLPTTAGAYQSSVNGGWHAFLTVIDPTGGSLVYSSFLAGSSSDTGQGIAVDPSGKVLVAGWTNSTDFPNSAGVTLTGAQTAFVAKFDIAQSGGASLLYSTPLPPAYYSSQAMAVKTDASGNAYAALQGILSATAGAYSYDAINASSGGVYVAQLNPSGVPQFMSYLGYGTVSDIAVDNAGNAYLTGTVYSGDMPATSGAYQTSFPNAYVAKLNAGGRSLAWSSYLGGPSGHVYPTSIAIPAGCTTNCTPVVTGYTYDQDFPVVNAIQNTLGGSYDAFLVSMAADGSTATISTYLGGTGDDANYYYSGYHVPQVALDGSSNIYVAGDTGSSDFPFTTRGTGYTFISKISPGAGALIIPDQVTVYFSGQTLGVQSAAQVVNLRNYGTTAAIINSGLSFDNPAFTSTDNCGGSVPAGGSCAVQVFYTPSVAGTSTGTLSVSYNDGTGIATATVGLSGYGYDRAELHVTPGASVYFGAVQVNTTSAAYTFTAQNVGSQPATIYSIGVGNSTNFAITATNCPGILDQGASCTFSITFTPQTIGSLSTYYQISTNANVIPYYYQYMYGTGSGLGTAGITSWATIVNFPDQVVGTTSSVYYAELQNTGSVPVTFGTAAITGDFVIYYSGCDGYTVSPGDTCPIEVQFRPTTTGTRTGTVAISNSAGPDQVISLAGNGVVGAPGLVFSPQSVVFSDQVVGTASPSVYTTVTNTGNIPVTITRVYDNGGPFQLAYNGCLTALSAFSSCSVAVKFAPSSAGALTGTLTFVDSLGTQTTSYIGNGVSPVASLIASPTSAAFDDAVVGSAAGSMGYLYFYNPGNLRVTTSTPVPSSADWVVTYNACSTVNPGATCEIDVQFLPQAAGTRTGTLTIANSASGSALVISLSGNGLTPSNSVVANPLTVSFPDQVVGSNSSSQTVIFYNPGNAPVTVTGATALAGTNSSEFVITSDGCSNATIQPASYCQVYVQFAPTGSAGSRNATLTITDNAPASPHGVSLSGNAINAVASLIATPANLGFDDQVVGTTSSQQPITLYNPGNTAVTISNTAVSGDFAVTSACSSIPAHSNCNTYVTFTPTASGARSGTLTLTDTATGSPHGISLYGNGLAASRTVAVFPASLDFGNVLTSTTSTAQLVYVLNTGTQSVTITPAPSAGAPYTVTGCNVTLNPGTSCSMSVTVNSATAGSFPGTLTITDNASGSPQTVSLAANIVATTPTTSKSPNGLTFDHRVVNTTSAAIGMNFVNRSGSTITFTGTSTTGDFAAATNNCSSGVANNGSCSVSVTFTPTATGMRAGTLVFSQAAGATSISLTGYGDAATSVVQLSATALSYPDQVVGTTNLTQTLRIWNNGSTPLTFGSPTITMNPVGVPVDFTIASNGCTGSVSAGSSCTLSINYAPSIVGNMTGTLSIPASDPASPHIVSLAGIGVASTKTMEPSPTSVQFNDQVIGTTSGTEYIYFYNTGNTAVTGSASSITAGDFSIQYDGCNTTISPRSYCYVGVVFAPTTTGSRTATLSANNNATGSPQTVALAGNAVTSIKSYRVTASAMTFNDQAVGTQGSTQYVYFYNTGTAALNLSGSTVSGGDYQIYDACSARTLPANSYCYVAVSFLPTATGSRTGTLTITNDAPAGNASISLSGNGVSPTKLAHLSATSLVFADQAIGVTSSYQYVYVYNTGNVGVNVGTLSTSGDFNLLYDYCSGYTISAGSYCTFYVTFKPTAAGARTGSITVPDDSTTNPHTLSLSGTGLTPSLRLTINPGNMNFPPTPTGSTSQTLEVQVSNVGNAPVQITSAALSTSDFKITYNSCTNTTLQPGSNSYYYSCYVDVQFQPTTTGALTDTLTLVDTATGSPHTVPLSGTGITSTAAVQLSQNTITFPNTTVNIRSSAAVVYLSNLSATTNSISNVTVSGDYSVNGCSTGTSVYQYSYCNMYVYFTPTAAGVRSGSITITDNSASSPHVITLSGSGINPAPVTTLTPSSLSFGSAALGQTTASQAVSINNTGSAPLTVTGIVSTSTDFPLSSSCLTTIAAGSSCNFYVQFTPQAAGTRTASIQITDNAAGSPHVLPLSGSGIGSLVQLSPTTLNFGNQVLSAASTPQSITLTNAGNATLNISSISGSGDFSQTNNCPPALSGGGTCSIVVTFTPSALGVRTASISIVDDGAGSPQTAIVQGVGVQPQADLALTGIASPPAVPPNGSTTYLFTIYNGGPSTATGLAFTATLPTNASVTGVSSPSGTCTLGNTISCVLNDLVAYTSTTVSFTATNTAVGNMVTTGSVTTTQSDLNTANNSASVTANAGVADLSLAVSPLSPGPGYVFDISNGGPSSATSATLTCAYNRYGYNGATSTQGSCSMSGGSLTCFIGNIRPGAKVSVTQLVQPPSGGWAGIACHAAATEYDSNPVNNSAQISPGGVSNTTAGDNIAVQLIDRFSGQMARVVFPSVSASGVTTLTGVAGAAAPAGYRNGGKAWTYDVTTTAVTAGSPALTFAVSPGQFRHPALVRLFHLENGAWVDRTVAQDLAAATVAAIAPNLSPFALFEPLDRAPLANAGTDRFAAASSAAGAKVTLDAGASTDADGDALTYRWTGPFPEGNGMVTGVRPSVTLPFGASRITLVVNDGEADSTPAAVSYTVTDFGIAPVANKVDVVRGSSATIPVQVGAVGGAYDQPVTLSCSGLPAGVSCSFSPATVQPGANGASSNLTISSTTIGALHRRPATWAFAAMLFGFVGVFGWSEKRRRNWVLLGLVLLALLIAAQVGCGGGSVSGFSNQPAPSATTTVTVTVQGTSAGLSHSSNVTVTLH